MVCRRRSDCRSSRLCLDPASSPASACACTGRHICAAGCWCSPASAGAVIGDLVYHVEVWAGSVQFPAPSDAVYLISYAGLGAGVLAMVRTRAVGQRPRRLSRRRHSHHGCRRPGYRVPDRAVGRGREPQLRGQGGQHRLPGRRCLPDRGAGPDADLGRLSEQVISAAARLAGHHHRDRHGVERHGGPERGHRHGNALAQRRVAVRLRARGVRGRHARDESGRRTGPTDRRAPIRPATSDGHRGRCSRPWSCSRTGSGTTR